MYERETSDTEKFRKQKEIFSAVDKAEFMTFDFVVISLSLNANSRGKAMSRGSYFNRKPSRP